MTLGMYLAFFVVADLGLAGRGHRTALVRLGA